MTSKGQITIPKRVREKLGLRPGDEIEFVEEDSTFRIRKEITESPFTRYRGYLESMAGEDPDELVDEARGP